MRKIFIAFILSAVTTGGFCGDFINLPAKYSSFSGQGTTRNYLPINTAYLQDKYGIKTVIYADYKKDIDLFSEALSYFYGMDREQDGKIILIYISKSNNKGVILGSDNLKKVIPEKYLKLLQDDVLNSLLGKWYISDLKVLAKITGTFIYLIEKSGREGAGMAVHESNMIKIDDAIYAISVVQPFRDIIKLFYLEPISFIIYFPFLMYFIIVRVIGFNLGKTVFYISNIMWVFLVVFVFILIINKVNIFYPEAVSVLTLWAGLNVPVYLWLFIMYGRNIEAAAYRYMYEITGGFEANNAFSGKGWK